jgi:muconolactone delta-isomerase
MQFMASIALDSTRRAEIERVLPAEQARVGELQQQRVLNALYIPDGAGPPDNLWAVFNGESQAAIQQVLESLPLYPYMQVELIPLRPLDARA